jgi:hypothetical protein
MIERVLLLTRGESGGVAGLSLVGTGPLGQG